MSLRNPRQLKDSSGKLRGWEARWREGGRATPEHRRRFLKQDGWTRKEVDNWCAGKLGERVNGAPREKEMPTLEDGRVAWLASAKSIEPITVQTHDINLRLHVGPLRDRRLDTITRADIKEQMARVGAIPLNRTRGFRTSRRDPKRRPRQSMAKNDALALGIPESHMMDVVIGYVHCTSYS